MKKQRITLWAVLMLLLFTGCHSTSVLTFDVWRPAEVTFPADVARVTVVNNSTDPDEREGNVYTDWNNKRFSLHIPHDSTSYRLAEQIAVALSQCNYFPEITLFYDDSITLPKATYPLLNAEQLGAIRDGVDKVAVVTLDDTDMRVTMTDSHFNVEYGDAFFYDESVGTLFSTELEVVTTVMMSIYWHNRPVPTLEQITDTLYWKTVGTSPDEAHAQMPPTEGFRQAAMESLADRVCRHFIPHLDHVERYIYTSTIPALADAYEFWQNQQYTEASYLWEYVYEEERSRVARAMAAANSALYYELNDNYVLAIDWLDKSLALFSEDPDQYSGTIAYLYDYRRQLEERRNDNSSLQQQM